MFSIGREVHHGPLGPSAGFREHTVALPVEITDAIVELAVAWARYRWGTSAVVRRVDPEARTIVVWGPDVASVPAELGAAIARGVAPSQPAGSRRMPRQRR